jgi:hypothetical protein
MCCIEVIAEVGDTGEVGLLVIAEVGDAGEVG